MNNYPCINALNLLGTPVSKKATDDESGGSQSIDWGDIVEEDQTTPGGGGQEVKSPFMDRYRGYDGKGNLVITPSGIGGGLAGLGAMGGALLPGKDTPWWKRMIYSLLGAGALGTAGYFGGKYLGSDPVGTEGEPGYVPGGWHTGMSPGYETPDEEARGNTVNDIVSGEREAQEVEQAGNDGDS